MPVALAAGARVRRPPVDDSTPTTSRALAAAECAAVLLPAAEFLGAEHRAPGRALLDAGALVVLATDANPGTAPVLSMPLVIGLGCAAVRTERARGARGGDAERARGRWGSSATRGSIEVGKRADLLVLDGPVDQIAYRFGHNPVADRDRSAARSRLRARRR